MASQRLNNLTNPLVIIPTYNERDNIEHILSSLRALPLTVDVLFVDDNSPDRTADIVRKCMDVDSQIFLLERPGKLGIGSAHRDAIFWAKEKGYQKVITMDCDLTHDPAIIPKMLSYLGTTDVVIGSRHLRPNSLPGWSLLRRLLTRLGYFLTCFFLKLPYDATGALRLYDLSRINVAIFSLVRANGYAFLFESLFVIWKNGYFILELPIELPARTYGSSKMSRAQAIVSLERLILTYLSVRFSPECYNLRSSKTNPIISSSKIKSDDWDQYWRSTQKETPKSLFYEIAALLFRNILIRPSLSRAIREHFAFDSRLLHAGCGSGQVDLDIRHSYSIFSIDRSQNAAIQCFYTNAPYEQICIADLFKLPFADDSFDGAYNLGVMEHFDEEAIIKVFSELARVTRKGGKLIFFWPTKRNLPGTVIEMLGYYRSNKMEDSSFIPPEISRYESKQQVEKWLKSAGLKLISASTSFRDLYTQAVIVAEK